MKFLEYRSKIDMWDNIYKPNSIGSEGGTIIADEEYKESCRITLERCERYDAITCGVYGCMMHTAFCNKSHSQEVFDNMKKDLQEFIDKDTTADEDPRWTQDRTQDRTQDGTQEDSKGSSEDEKIKRILEFCQTPKGILEITEMLGYSGRKPTKKYVKPLVEQGRLAMTIPDKPQSKNQKYVTVK